MKIAVTYDKGNVFQHFGHTEVFKIYETEGNEIVSSELMDTNGTGHEALAGLLKESGVDAVICGGMGQGAKDALTEAGLDVCAGQEGNADEIVKAYLRGELVDSGVNCDHHGEHDHEHGHEHGHSHDEGGCGGCADAGGCGGCAGCGAPQFLFEGKNVGKRVKVHYRGFFDDGEVFESSYERGVPIEFVCGIGQMISGFDRAVAELEPGETIEVHLEPEDAYGHHEDRLVITVEKEGVMGSEDVETGDKVTLQDQLGRPFDALVTDVTDTHITFDCNHEMAGKSLNFAIELLEAV
jgi:FKBP-type peptidyl-prolyl cis-trans isomerase 2/predicted Fe-Mo cluster-binding NifX family protein